MPDPLEHDAPLPLAQVYHPLGFPLVFRTNSALGLEAAERAWAGFPAVFNTPELEVRLISAPGGGAAPAPVFRAQRHLMSIVADAANFAACDHTRRFAYIRLNDTTLRDGVYVRQSFLESVCFHLLTQLYVTPVHAALVVRNGRGLLLCGPSGAGKSCLAYACAREGFTFVSDNDSWLIRDDVGVPMGRRAVNGNEDRLLARAAQFQSRDREGAVAAVATNRVFNGEHCIAGDPRRIRFRESAAEMFPELRAAAAYTSAAGKRSIDLPQTGWANLPTAFHGAAAALVFLNRNAPPGARDFARGRILEELLATIPAYEPDVSAAHRASLERLARLPALELGYAGVADGVDRLRILADSL